MKSLFCFAALLAVVSAFQREIVQILQPPELVAQYGVGGIPVDNMKPAMFGQPSYGADVEGLVMYSPAPDNTACHALTPFTLPPGEAVILLVDRGDCTFVTKVRNAQNAGATAVIVADNIVEPTLPYMADDSTGHSVVIPSLLIKKDDGDKLKHYILANNSVIVSMQWNLPNPDGIVEWEFWTSSDDDVSIQFKESFGKVARALGTSSVFTPHYFIINGDSPWRGCTRAGLPCAKQCTNSGRYCAVDPEHNFQVGLDGMDVVQENLRQICIWNYFNSTGNPYAWFDYVSAFENQCCCDKDKWNIECSLSIQRSFKDGAALTDYVNSCVTNSGGAPYEGDKNPLMEQQIQSMNDNGIFVLPTLIVNKVYSWGSTECRTLPDGIVDVEKCGVLQAICAGFQSGTSPAACNTDSGCDITLKRDECGICGGHGVLDACRVCLEPTSESFNKTCSGCDGVPNSGKTKDYCGVCGGTATSKCETSSSMISTPVIVGVSVVSLLVVGFGVYCYMRRQQNKMRSDIDTLLKQYLPLDQVNNMRPNTNESTTDNTRLVNGAPDSAADSQF